MIHIRHFTQKDALTGNKYPRQIIWKGYNSSMPTKTPTKTKKSEPIPEPVFESSPEPSYTEDTVTFKSSHFYSALVVLAFAVGILVGFVTWGRDDMAAEAIAANVQNGAQNAAGNVPQAAPDVITAPTEPSFVRYDIPIEGYPSHGPEDAPITIVEFSDFQCPFCRRFHEETYQALLDAYPGQIRFVYRNLPLTSIHPDAMPAAVASLCANDQGKYWEYHEKLFSSETLDEPTYIQYATDLGLDVDTFTACLSDGSHDEFIQQDMDFAINLGIQSTPTFFVNGLAIVGAQPLSNFTQLIDQDLAGEIPE
jgi:protein-disulfide isomerase